MQQQEENGNEGIGMSMLHMMQADRENKKRVLLTNARRLPT